MKVKSMKSNDIYIGDDTNCEYIYIGSYNVGIIFHVLVSPTTNKSFVFEDERFKKSFKLKPKIQTKIVYANINDIGHVTGCYEHSIEAIDYAKASYFTYKAVAIPVKIEYEEGQNKDLLSSLIIKKY